MPRAYTKSGNIEKYESNYWQSPIWNNNYVCGTISPPDSDGKYVITPNSNHKTCSSPTDLYCITKYNKVEYKVYFEKLNITITITGQASLIGGTQYKGRLHANIKVPCDVTATVKYEKYLGSGGSQDGLSFTLTIKKGNYEATTQNILGDYNSSIGHSIAVKSISGSPSTYEKYNFVYKI